MTAERLEQLNPKTQHKLYSEKAINIATFLGGPIAAGILIRKNFINLGNENYAKHTIAIAVVSTVLVFAITLSLPEDSFLSKFYKLIPIIYTAIIAVILHQFQGNQIKTHEENNGEFYSGWKAAGIGVLSMIGMLTGIFGFVLMDEPDFDAELYDQKIDTFYTNEEEALNLFSKLENEEFEQATNFIYRTGIPKWQENLQVLDEMDTIVNGDQDFLNQNKILREYCELRIQSYQLIGKSISKDEFDPKIDEINIQINELLEKLN